MKPRWYLYMLALVISISALVYITSKISANNANKGSEDSSMITEKKIIRAPELMGGTEWLNTDRPIYLKDLKGKVVLLDFWTYACINCMHVIPDLKRLEAKYPNELVVIGVHSAKFTNERIPENIRQAILRYGIEHPVVNDSEFRIWRSYGVRAWPTLVVINPEGYVAGAISGEGNYEILDKVIGALIEEYSKEGKINNTPINFALEKYKSIETILSFPGKVATNGQSGDLGLIFISDSNNNRIIISDTDGNIKDTIGSGNEGKDDGHFEIASFKKPQGLFFYNKYLYVADTENHLIRRCDLVNKTVETIAGTGNQARGYSEGGNALQTSLNSPWDLLIINDKIYIAMAGWHQIWVMDLKTNYIKPYAGSGREGRLDGKLMESDLAQPSGITTDKKQLFIADSESSSIRAIDLDLNGKVETIVGLDLFEFGDVDGTGREVRLQHPLGVLFHNGKIYVADTYNHKIKIVDPKNKTSKTFLGNGKPGYKDGRSPEFFEPGGLAISGNNLYVADTNNHRIRIVDISTGIVGTLNLKGLDITDTDSNLPVENIVLPLRKIRAGRTGKLAIDIKFPPSFGLTEGAPLEYKIEPCKGGNAINILESERLKIIDNPSLPINIPLNILDVNGNCQIRLDLTFNYCNKKDETCSIKSLRLYIPVQVSKEEGDQRIFVEYKLTP